MVNGLVMAFGFGQAVVVSPELEHGPTFLASHGQVIDLAWREHVQPMSPHRFQFWIVWGHGVCFSHVGNLSGIRFQHGHISCFWRDFAK